MWITLQGGFVIDKRPRKGPSEGKGAKAKAAAAKRAMALLDRDSNDSGTARIPL